MNKSQQYVQIEGQVPAFKRLCICLGACREGFRAFCRLVNVLDGCCLNSAQGEQLFTVVGIGGENCMFSSSLDYCRCREQKKLEWFIELSIFHVGMYNNRVWIIISNKHKGFINSINLFCEEFEHRFHIRHLYSNFTLLHKDLNLKSLFQVAVRAIIVLEYRSAVNEMNIRMKKHLNGSKINQPHSGADHVF